MQVFLYSRIAAWISKNTMEFRPFGRSSYIHHVGKVHAQGDLFYLEGI